MATPLPGHRFQKNSDLEKLKPKISKLKSFGSHTRPMGPHGPPWPGLRFQKISDLKKLKPKISKLKFFSSNTKPMGPHGPPWPGHRFQKIPDLKYLEPKISKLKSFGSFRVYNASKPKEFLGFCVFYNTNKNQKNPDQKKMKPKI